MNPKGWDLYKLRNWLEQSLTQEDHSFDLKEKIPEDESGKCRLKKEFCAFANGKGGFLFFGIDRDKGVVGVDRNGEFTTRLSQIVTTHVTPATINWNLYECIDLEDGGRCEKWYSFFRQ